MGGREGGREGGVRMDGERGSWGWESLLCGQRRRRDVVGRTRSFLRDQQILLASLSLSLSLSLMMLPRLISHSFLYLRSYLLSLCGRYRVPPYQTNCFDLCTVCAVPHFKAAGDPLSWMHYSQRQAGRRSHSICAFFPTLASEPRLIRDSRPGSLARPLALSPCPPRVCSCFLSLLPSGR